MTLQQNYDLAKLTEKVLNKGLDYIVTLGSEVTVELIDEQGKVLALCKDENVETALESLLERFNQ